MQRAAGVAGILLTGGASRRLGIDKALVTVGGRTCVERAHEVLVTALGGPFVEVGPGWSGFPTVREDPPRSGPLVAISVGWRALGGAGHRGPAVVLATDMPLVTAELVHLLATWPGSGSAVPLVAGRLQPVCARWSAAALDRTADLVAAGERSMHPLLAGPDVEMLDEAAWGAVASAEAFTDLDTPDDVARLRRSDN